MFKKVKASIAKHLREESGQALIAVLALLMIGSLTLPPMLSHIGTALKTGQVYESDTDELYAADSGIEDAIWQIRYDRLEVLLSDPEYDSYDFGTAWTYILSEPINDLPVDITIQNVWIPKDVTPLSPSEARDIIESNKLMVAGTAPGGSTYQIKLSFYPDAGEEGDLMVESLGIWLPLGYTYVTDSSNLEDDQYADYYSVPTVEDYNGGQAVVWEYESVPFTSFPGVNIEDVPMTTDITFGYTPSQPGVSPVAIAWMVTSGVSDVPISWDVDTRIYKITSIAGGTEVEAYSAKCELRKMGAAIAGDYRAVGNSLMIDNPGYPYDIRDELLDESDAEVTDISSNAEVIAAYLYWSGWFAEGTPQPVFEDGCSDFGDWISGSAWSINSGHFRSHYSSGAEDTRYLTMKNSLDLSSYASGTIEVSWDHWEEDSLESGDALRFQFSDDGGDNWSDMITAFSNDIGSTPEYFSYTVPDEYLTNDFKFRFYLQGFGDDDEYCHVDNFAISEEIFTADESVIFKINDTQVYLDAQGDPQQGAQPLTAGSAQTFRNPWQSGYAGFSYACKRDVTKLVKAYSDLGSGENHTGNGEYTVGDVQADTGHHLSYAGWSLIIVYSSPETAGHHLYLYDDFAFNPGNGTNLDFDDDSEPGGSIEGFFIPEPPEDLEQYPNAAKLTVFVGEGDDWFSGDYLSFNDTNLSDGFSTNNVWNGSSIGMSYDGVDIDTFYITWASGLLEPDDTTAQLDLPSEEAWNLVYIILSLRSETVTGSTTHYVIHGG
ncbi:hypothetical protein ACFLUZ_05600 [Chloroflexota bacterium]